MIKEKNIELSEILNKYCIQQNLIGEIPAYTDDIEKQWPSIIKLFIPDSLAVINNYPLVPLGWILYIGMAVANLWDSNWEKFSNSENLYLLIKKDCNFDFLDDYILEDLIGLPENEIKTYRNATLSCAELALTLLKKTKYKSSSTEMYKLYIDTLHSLFLIGASLELYRLGYKMNKL